VCGVVDNWPDKLRKNRKMFTFICVLILFLFDIPMITQVNKTSINLNLIKNEFLGWSVHLPTDGLLQCQWDVDALFSLLPDHIHRLDIRCESLLRLRRTDERSKTFLVLLHLLAHLWTTCYGGNFKFKYSVKNRNSFELIL